MPIANCIISPDCHSVKEDLVTLWTSESGIKTQEMTVNVITSNQQFGKRYKIMATLYLPSAWPQASIILLQVGLATALSKFYAQPLEQVHVITQIVESGLVVEAGTAETW